MAWEDRTPFDAILLQFGLKEQDVIKLMRKEMKLSSFKNPFCNLYITAQFNRGVNLF